MNMRKYLMVLAAGAVCAMMGRASAQDVEPGFRSIFNGTDLTGWDGNRDLWFVKDGAIFGQTTLVLKVIVPVRAEKFGHRWGAVNVTERHDADGPVRHLQPQTIPERGETGNLRTRSPRRER